MKNVINIKDVCNDSEGKNNNKNTSISITETSKEPYSSETENTCVFKVSDDGKVIIGCKLSENNIKGVTVPSGKVSVKEESLNEIPLKEENIVDMFENLPKDLSEKEINKIIEFLNKEELNKLKKTGCGSILPYSVELTDNGDIKITLVIYNGGKIQLSLSQMPIKLTDVNKAIVMAELVDINAVVNYGKIGVFENIVTKDKLKENNINLEEWNITFTM
ncbi:SLAP domain-containing protein [Clostridium sp.]|jgi:SLAP domain-containing protein|uniref:SLAP domain-containing protein n=1 Tax=Clostridium sp. TaxID=1506 RepID=UPI003EEE8B96